MNYFFREKKFFYMGEKFKYFLIKLVLWRKGFIFCSFYKCMNRRKERVNIVKYVYSEYVDNELTFLMNWFFFFVNLFSVVNLFVFGISLKACFIVDFIVL